MEDINNLSKLYHKCKTKCSTSVATHVAPSVATLQDGLADWLRKLEPFSWFATLTFLTDIRTYKRENPTLHIERYEWKDHTEKYTNGTYVRVPDELNLEPVKSDWLSNISYNK